MRHGCIRDDLGIDEMAKKAHLPKRNETPPLLIPKRETHTAETFTERQAAHTAKLGVVTERQRQVVIGNPAAQVVDMVYADVGGEPAQDSRQVVVRASAQGRLVQGPLTIAGPEGSLKLMLNVE